MFNEIKMPSLIRNHGFHKIYLYLARSTSRELYFVFLHSVGIVYNTPRPSMDSIARKVLLKIES